MPIKSYLAIPRKGQKEQLHIALKNIAQCEVMPADNEDVLILISDTADKQEEEILLSRLSGIESLEHLNLIAGFKDED